ncbi:MAG: hypothetical protein HY742_00535 [Deltaproteobacteria bacterium]|nr:hypothetical protein [Deltaproteobacteria bacterium]
MHKPRFCTLCLFVLVLLGGACSSIQRAPDGERHPPQTASSLPGEMSFFGPAEDTELFNSALSSLNEPAHVDDYASARADIETLLKAYPKSKWRSLSEKLILLIDNAASHRRLAEKSLADKNRLAQENDQLKRQMRALHEKLQTETSGLAQENEQLRKDIQTLKNLEIELEKRDRKLR